MLSNRVIDVSKKHTASSSSAEECQKHNSLTFKMKADISSKCQE
jgi:hypothetical protein